MEDNWKGVKEATTTAEKAAREGNMKEPYETTKKRSQKYCKPERPVKGKEVGQSLKVNNIRTDGLSTSSNS
ncbi:unnamed protein product [Schistosoma margrebowiei]|uniref:Uncharacterized protein n=1 Tax=Schistosoma margrebowiei TaxID=48269 RepID=A0A183LWA2_9TREM|nr:unnamed protein product [Schistosoma margrebowiei]